MRKAFKAFILTAVLVVCFSVPAAAADVIAVSDLIENTAAFDGQAVTVEGEAIGEAMYREEHAWVNLNDGTNAIGIWMKASDAKAISYYGDYKHIGDTVRVTGIFSKDCPEHGGDVDIHSTSIEIIQQGHIVSEIVSPGKILSAGILFCVSLIIYAYYKALKDKYGKSPEA